MSRGNWCERKSGYKLEPAAGWIDEYTVPGSPQAIDAAEAGDYQPLDDLLRVVASPFDDHPELADYARPPKPEEVVQRTFCGT